MRIIPLLLDARASYLGNEDSASSLLLLPTGTGTVLEEVAERIADVTQHAPLLLPRFEAGPRYLDAVRRAVPGIAAVVGSEVFRDPLSRFDPSDTLLIVSADCYPLDGLDLRPLIEARVRDSRILRHLLAFETAPLGAKEFVQPGADGRLRRVQRYFEPVTWPFPAGIVASCVPVSCVLVAGEAEWTSLTTVRTSLAAQGVPSQDVTYHGRLVDLGDEAGALALAERRIVQLVDEASAARRSTSRGGAADTSLLATEGPLVLGAGVHIDPSARFVGPVVVGDDVRVEADALVVGPAMLARGVHVERGATVAQCLVTDGARVASGATVRHRVVADGAGGRDDAPRAQGQRRETRGGTPAPSAPARVSSYPRIKAAVEPVLALVALALLAPIMLVCALLVALDSGFPIFYGDRREGRGGAAFRCWKFRSMRPDADALQKALAAAQQLDGPQFKMDRDPRVTRVGAWLRRLNVDELPQLWNVVRGEMSFVGPRPSPFRENQICIPWRHGRLSVRPGITGLWQVCRRDRGAGDFHQWIHYDLLYVRHASFAVDLRILVATIR
ncbi:MAG TPA: sugar transferase, partial [Gemmatirosa sp.]